MAVVGAAAVAVVAVLAVGLGIGRSHDGVSVYTDDPTSVPPSTVDTSGPGWTTVVDRDGGFTIDVPPGWSATTDSLVSWMTNPEEIFSAATYPLEHPADPGQQAAACDAVIPIAAVQGGPTDVFITIQDEQAGRDVFPPDATVSPNAGDHRIGEGSFESVHSRTDFSCAAKQRPGTDARWIWFTSPTRSFLLAVVIGPDASETTRTMLWGMLDSFQPI